MVVVCSAVATGAHAAPPVSRDKSAIFWTLRRRRLVAYERRIPLSTCCSSATSIVACFRIKLSGGAILSLRGYRIPLSVYRLR